MKSSQCFSFFVLISTICFLSTAAHAGGYSTQRFGGEHGHAASDHPTSIYYNPAALALGAGTRVYVEGLFVYRQASYLRRAGAIDNLGTGTPDNDTLGIEANSGQAELGNFWLSPFLGIGTDVGVDGLALGAGVYLPFGGQATWDTDDRFADNDSYPGALDGAQRWASIEGYHRVYYATATASYRLAGPRLSIGVGFNFIRQDLSTVRARNFDGTDDLFASNGSISEGRTLVEGTENSYSVSAGIVWEPMETLRVGFSYQSRPGFGDSELEGTLTNKFGDLPATPTDTVLQLAIPDIYRLGITHQPIPRTEIRIAGDYTRWSVFKRHCLVSREFESTTCALQEDGARDIANGGEGVLVVIPRDWTDTFGVRVGGSYWLVPELEVFAGLSFDSNAVPDETLEAGFIDMNKIISSVGVRYELLDGTMRVTGAFTNVSYIERETQPRRDDLESPSRNPDGAGKYDQMINFVTLGAEYAF